MDMSVPVLYIILNCFNFYGNHLPVADVVTSYIDEFRLGFRFTLSFLLLVRISCSPHIYIFFSRTILHFWLVTDLPLTYIPYVNISVMNILKACLHCRPAGRT